MDSVKRLGKGSSQSIKSPEIRAKSIFSRTSGLSYGPGGNRTRVRKQFPRGFSHHSCFFAFPPHGGKQQPPYVSSFMIRLHTQSLVCIVSRDHDAGDREHGYSRADERTYAATATVLLSVKFRVPVIAQSGLRMASSTSLPPSKPVQALGDTYHTTVYRERQSLLCRLRSRLFSCFFEFAELFSRFNIS